MDPGSHPVSGEEVQDHPDIRPDAMDARFNAHVLDERARLGCAERAAAVLPGDRALESVWNDSGYEISGS